MQNKRRPTLFIFLRFRSSSTPQSSVHCQDNMDRSNCSKQGAGRRSNVSCGIQSVTLFHSVSIISQCVRSAAAPPSFIPSQIMDRGSVTAQSSRTPLIESPFLFASESSTGNRIERFTKSNVLVQIERTARNQRRISGEMVLHGSGVSDGMIGGFNGDQSNGGLGHAIGMIDLWNILTDYDNLSTHVPNLVESRIISHNRRQKKQQYGHHTTTIGPRVYQKGAQRIWGFEFGADVTMDMKETVMLGGMHGRKCILDFKCVTSQFFSQFDGSWIVEELATPLLSSNGVSKAATTTKTSVKYVVDVKPKLAVPVAALEWRIKEDVPPNMLGVANAAIKAKRKQTCVEVMESSPSYDYMDSGINAKNEIVMDWYKDETMAMYLY
jgi:hypothetical protein